MRIIHEGLNAYALVNGRKMLVMAEREVMGIDETIIYDYTKGDGVLKLNPSNLPEGALERLATNARAHPETGINVTLDLDVLGDKFFIGVKSVEPVPQGSAMPGRYPSELN